MWRDNGRGRLLCVHAILELTEEFMPAPRKAGEATWWDTDQDTCSLPLEGRFMEHTTALLRSLFMSLDPEHPYMRHAAEHIVNGVSKTSTSTITAMEGPRLKKLWRNMFGVLSYFNYVPTFSLASLILLCRIIYFFLFTWYIVSQAFGKYFSANYACFYNLKWFLAISSLVIVSVTTHHLCSII